MLDGLRYPSHSAASMVVSGLLYGSGMVRGFVFSWAQGRNGADRAGASRSPDHSSRGVNISSDERFCGSQPPCVDCILRRPISPVKPRLGLQMPENPTSEGRGRTLVIHYESLRARNRAICSKPRSRVIHYESLFFLEISENDCRAGAWFAQGDCRRLIATRSRAIRALG